MDIVDTLQTKLTADLLQKADALLQGIQKGQFNFRAGNFYRNPRKACTCADINHAHAVPPFHAGNKAQAIGKMLQHHLTRLGDSSQVHFFIPFQQQRKIGHELLRLFLSQRNTHLFTAIPEQCPIFHLFLPLSLDTENFPCAEGVWLRHHAKGKHLSVLFAFLGNRNAADTCALVLQKAMIFLQIL